MPGPSLTDSRADAWRCFVGSTIHDPCFSNLDHIRPYVLCPLYTPRSKALEVKLTKAAPGPFEARASMGDASPEERASLAHSSVGRSLDQRHLVREPRWHRWHSAGRRQGC
jgi:hypothetical protein